MWQIVQDAVRAALLLAEVDEEEHGKVGAAEGQRRGQNRHLVQKSGDRNIFCNVSSKYLASYSSYEDISILPLCS